MTGLGTAFAVYRGYIIERGTYFCSRAARKEKERTHDARDDTSFGLVPWDRNDDSLLTHNVIFAVNYTPPNSATTRCTSLAHYGGWSYRCSAERTPLFARHGDGAVARAAILVSRVLTEPSWGVKA